MILDKQLTTTVLIGALLTLVSCLSLSAENSSASHPKVDGGKETFAVDGPYVFYKKDKIIVKQITCQDGGIKVNAMTYNSKEEITSLICTVDNKQKTKFPITLHSTYEIPPSQYPQPEKLFLLSDIEGNFAAMQQTLEANGIIDKNLQWIYGKGHLALLGDFFDRGTNVTAVLWLIYELERQAKEAGGMVHFIIGNHEEMNLRGDTRYVKKKYLVVAKAMKKSIPSLYSNHTELGKWLRSKNVIEKIGKTILVHGGLSPEMADYRFRLDDMNKTVRSYIGMDKWKLEQRGGDAKILFDKLGPMWYRGYFRGELSQERINYTLDIYGADQVVVGHTVVPKVSAMHNKRVIGIDVKHEIALASGVPNALLIQKGKFIAVNSKGQHFPLGSLLCAEDVQLVLENVRKNNTKEVLAFVRKGNSINKCYSNQKMTLLHYAIKHDRPEIVKALLAEGANIEQRLENKTPLMYAIRHHKPEIISILLHKGANINAINPDQQTPLFFCARYGNLKLIKYLIGKGVDLSHRDQKGRSAAEYAMKYDNKEVAVYLKSL